MTSPSETPTWDPPGPGTWIADRSHGRPGATPLFRRLASEGTFPAYWDAFREMGAPAASIDFRFVNGQFYRRVVPLVGAKFDRGAPPPAPVVKLLTRVHPAFRREERAAQNTLDTKPYLDAIRNWHDHERESWIAENRGLQAVDVGAVDDDELAGHVDDLNDILERGWYRHHRLHAYDLGPIGDLLAHTLRWGLDSVETMSLLRGASPATVEGAVHGRTIAAALRDAGVDPTSIRTVDEIRAVPEASDALDAYLDTYGWRLAGGYDIDSPVLNELPSAICGVVRSAASNTDDVDAANAETHARLRQRCPDPDLFDSLVADARAGYGVRDDNGPLTSQWPTGLARRAYLEAGRRLAARERLASADHVFELDAPELAAMLRGSTDLGPDEVAERAAHRAWEQQLRGPDHLGPEPVVPDLAPLPPALRRMMEIINAAVTLLEPDPDGDVDLAGLGIGESAYEGRACVAHDASDAIARLEPGDVLVAPFTSPSFNSVLPMAGAMVVQEGGLLSHAAVMARELDIPAVIGCQAALEHIDDGATIIVDPEAGEVRLA